MFRSSLRSYPTFSSTFFNGSSSHAQRPTFPTRRSSDLDPRPPYEPRYRAAPLNTGISFGGSSILALVIGRHQLDGRDRKSTRLNSSHVAISYAVFCLKKKKD